MINIKLKQYKGGGKNSHNSTYLSTPQYMSFADALYLSKYGSVRGGNQELVVNKNEKHYIKTITQWGNKLNQLGINNEDEVINNPKNIQNALRIKFQVISDKKAIQEIQSGGRITFGNTSDPVIFYTTLANANNIHNAAYKPLFAEMRTNVGASNNNFYKVALNRKSGFDGLKIIDNKLYIDRNGRILEWKSDTSIAYNVDMMFKYYNIKPNHLSKNKFFLDLISGFIAHNHFIFKKDFQSTSDYKHLVKVEIERQMTQKGGKTFKKHVARKSTKRLYRGGNSYNIGDEDSHTVIGFSNNNEFFTHNKSFGDDMRDKIRAAIMSKNLTRIDGRTLNMSIGYVISGVLNNFDNVGARPFADKLEWIRGGMFINALNWVIDFQEALNEKIDESKDDIITCSFNMIHIAEDEREFSEENPYEELQSRQSFTTAFNEYMQQSITENELAQSLFNPLLVTPPRRIPLNVWNSVFQASNLNMIMLHGGETHWLNRRLKKSGLMDALVANKNIICAGSSAGIINCGITTALAASKRYSQLTNPSRSPLVGGDDPLVLLNKDGDDITLGDVYPNIRSSSISNIQDVKTKSIIAPEVSKLLTDESTTIGDDIYPPFNTCDFNGMGIYPGVVFPHVTDDSKDVYYELLQEQVENVLNQYPQQIKHIEVLSDMQMFLYHKGVSTTYSYPDEPTINSDNKEYTMSIREAIESLAV